MKKCRDELLTIQQHQTWSKSHKQHGRIWALESSAVFFQRNPKGFGRKPNRTHRSAHFLRPAWQATQAVLALPWKTSAYRPKTPGISYSPSGRHTQHPEQHRGGSGWSFLTGTVSIDRETRGKSPKAGGKASEAYLLLLLLLWGVKEKERKTGSRSYYSGCQDSQCGRVTCQHGTQSRRVC
jgi:hypothetical protein